MKHPTYKQARSLLMMQHPFYATVLLHLEERAAPEWCTTMATDGKVLYVHDDFVEKLTLEECVGVLIHEIMHVVFQHPLRLTEMVRDQGWLLTSGVSEVWNWACDYAINALIRKERDITLPTPHLYDPQYEGMTAEEIFDRLTQQGGKGSVPPGSCIGDVMPLTDDAGGPASDADLIKARLDTEALVVQAAQVAKRIGRLPGSMEELIKELTTPKANWREALWSFISATRDFGTNWTRPNRRFLDSDIVLPSHGAHGIPALNCILDTSGSVSHEDLVQFLSEVNAAVESFDIKDVILVQCDTMITSIEHSTSGDRILPPVKGRGGTDMNPAFAYLAEQRPAPTILFSDMHIPVVANPPAQTIWCRRGGGQGYPAGALVIDVD